MNEIALQNLFYRAVYQRDNHSLEELSQKIIPPKNLTPAESIAIYRGSVVGTLRKTLASTYPVCCQLVGEKFFEAMAVKFIEQFPCKSPNLGNYGLEFSEFLADFKPVKNLGYLPDVARLEWHWHKVFSGEDTKLLDLEKLGQVPQKKWENLVFKLPKNSVLLESIYPIHRIWQVNQSDYQGDESVSLEEGGVRIFLWRKEYDMRIELPTESEWQLLNAFQSSDSFDNICKYLANRVDVTTLLPIFVQRGWIADFVLS